MSDTDEELCVTQQQTDVFVNISEQYGGKSRSQFIEDLSEEYTTEDLGIYRQALYDYSVKKVPNTPRATLVTRKDTSNKSGGVSLSIKLSEDVYKLFHYIEGDQSVDLCKLFPDKDRTRIRDQMMSCSQSQHSSTDTTGDNPRVPGAMASLPTDSTDADLAKSVLKFCDNFLTSMRVFQDSLKEDIKQIKADTSVILEVRADLKSVQKDINDMGKRVDVLDKTTQSQQKQIDKLNNTCNRLLEDRALFKTSLDDKVAPIRSDITMLTHRVNALDLSRSTKSYAAVATSPVPVRDSRASQPTGPSLSSSSPRIQQDGTRPSPASPVLHNAPLALISDDPPDKKSATSQSDDIPKAAVDTPRSLTLSGFIPREKRPKLEAVYVSGITTVGSAEDVTNCVSTFLSSKNIPMRSVKIVGEKGNTMAAKVVINLDDVPRVVHKDFWPAGINVRKWITKEKEK